MPQRVAVAALAVLLASCATPTQPLDAVSEEDPSRRDLAPGELLATYYPTPDLAVEHMLELADVREGELLYDLGSGDGRIVIRAAEQYGAEAVGFEIDRELIDRSRRRIAERGLEARARIVEQDLMEADYAAPDVVTMFLTPEGLEKLVPHLDERLRPGVRVVAYKFPLPGWTPDQTVAFDDDDPETPEHEVFFYQR